MKLELEQRLICEKYSADYVPVESMQKLGISKNVNEGIYPVHGLRHPPTGDTSGWCIWAAEYSDDVNFFLPLHAEHIDEWNPTIKKYLGLGPGWRFLVAEGYEDVWFDETLLNV